MRKFENYEVGRSRMGAAYEASWRSRCCQSSKVMKFARSKDSLMAEVGGGRCCATGEAAWLADRVANCASLNR